MQTTTLLHELLRSFRDQSGAQACSISSDFGTRVEVGRPTTLSADELMALTTSTPTEGGADAPAVPSRRLFATVIGYSIAAEFESEEAADKAQPQFEKLVLEIESAVQNPD